MIAQLKFTERRRLAEASLCDPSAFAAENDYRRHIGLCKDMIALCRRRERRRPRTYRLRRELSIKTADDLIILPKSGIRNIPLKYKGFRCLFCLASDLPLKNREQSYASKYLLQRHTDRCRLNRFKTDEKVPCPDNIACGEILDSKMHFKNHAARVHSFVL